MRCAAICVVLLATGARLPATAAMDDHQEYQVKAGFLFNFLKFVEWPTGAGGGAWVLGVLGQDPFGELLDDTVRDKTVNGRPIVVRRYARLADVHDCHILFVSQVAFKRMGTPVLPGLLTVGESSGFLASGGAINFYLKEKKVHFEIKPEAARAAGLRVGAQLLKLGRTL